jgi:hypothetical protein
MAGGGKKQAERDIGDVLGQHIRRVGHPDAALTRIGQIDRVRADAVAGDDLQVRQAAHQFGGCAEFTARRNGADRIAEIGQKAILVGALPETMNRVGRLKLRHVPLGICPCQQDAWVFSYVIDNIYFGPNMSSAARHSDTNVPRVKTAMVRFDAPPC